MSYSYYFWSKDSLKAWDSKQMNFKKNNKRKENDDMTKWKQP